MPLFYYECKECKKTTEILVKSTNEKVTCPNCGSKKMEKMLSHFAPHGTSHRKRKFVGTIDDTCTSCESNTSSGCGCSWCRTFKD